MNFVTLPRFSASLMHRLGSSGRIPARADWHMVVKTLHLGRRVTGVEVGVVNVRRYFSQEAAEIELLLDHLQIQCGLTPGFWQGDTAICDPRLSAWLESKYSGFHPSDPPIPLALIPSGKNCFRLRPIAPRFKSSPAPANPA